MHPPDGSPSLPPELPRTGDATSPVASELTPEYAAPALSPRRVPTWAVVLSWLVILAAVTFIAWRASATQFRKAASNEPDFALPMQAKYALGVRELMTMTGRADARTTADQLLPQLDKSAKAPEDKMRVAILAGELRGKDEAIARLEALVQAHPEMANDARFAKFHYLREPLLPSDRPPLNPPASADQKTLVMTELTTTAGDFHEKYGWFAELLESNGKPDTDPQRAAVLRSGLVVVFVMLGALAAAAVLSIAGLVLFIIALVQLARGKIKLAFVRGRPGMPPEDRGAYICGMAVYVGGYVVLGLAVRYGLMRLTQNSVVLTAASLGGLMASFFGGLLLPLALGQTRAQWKQALGLHTGRGVFREIGSGIVGYLAGLPLLVAGTILVAVLTWLAGVRGSHPIMEDFTGSPWLLLMMVFAACVIAPVTEELMFRGALFAHLRQRMVWLLSAPTMAVIFGLMHPQSWVALPALAAIAVTLGAIREWRGSIIGSMVAHGLHNGALMVLSVLLLR